MSIKADLDKAYQKKVVEVAEDKMRQAGLILFGEIVNNTPVDTGRARGNWNIEINAVDDSITDEIDPNGNNANIKALSAIQRYKLNDYITISNHLPYIERLNNGYSSQAPAGMVEPSIQVTLSKLEEL
jgi:hypothetical protein